MNPYNLNLSESSTQGPLASLTVLYEGIPETHGCDKCSEINGDEVDWCCKRNNPSMYYIEFLHVFIHVQKQWSRNVRRDLLLRAVRNYLDNSLSKGCIFYGNPGCSIHKHRPFSCSLYGVVPEENWKKRWDALKKRQGDDFEALPQCKLVSSEKEITAADEDKWFEHTKKCEWRIGVSQGTIDLHDKSGGTYRTFHDHLLLELMGEGTMHVLTNVRLTNPSKTDIDATVEEIRKILERGDSDAKTLRS